MLWGYRCDPAAITDSQNQQNCGWVLTAVAEDIELDNSRDKANPPPPSQTEMDNPL